MPTPTNTGRQWLRDDRKSPTDLQPQRLWVADGRLRRVTVAAPDDLSQSPAVLVAELCDVLGAAEVARWCTDLLSGRAAFDDPARPSLTWLGGGPAAAQLQQGNLVARRQDYWPRVWAARGLLYAWDQDVVAAPALVDALGDTSWRVREMVAKVVARHGVSAAAEGLCELVPDPVARVRAAAVRALGVVGTPAHVAAVRPSLDDENAGVRRAAAEVLDKGAGRSRRDSSDPGRGSHKKGKPPPQRRKDTPAKKAVPPAKAGRVGPRTRPRVTANDLDAVVSGAVLALRAGVERDWSVAANGLRWSCARTSGHIADDLVAYASQLAGTVRTGYLPFTFAPKRNTEPAGLLNLIEGMAALLSTVVRAAPASASAYHPYGSTDAEGFAALGVAEVLLHTHDIAAGLAIPYRPPSSALCTRVAARLDPRLEPYDDPWTLLLWATGRADIPGRDRVRRWRWQPGVHQR